MSTTVRGALEINVEHGTGEDPAAATFEQMAGLALRDNPRRAHLIVSRTLGKHIPAPPRAVRGGGHDLAERIRHLLPDHTVPAGTLVIGYCETATGLGHAVAEGLDAAYLHTTRRPAEGLPVAVSFEEEHSHAVAHHLQPGGSVSLAGAGLLVLVDDELTTGRTALNTVEALQARYPRSHYVIAALVDTRTPEVVESFDKRAVSLGVQVEVVSLLQVRLRVPEDVLDRAGAARAGLPAAAALPEGTPGQVVVHDGWWPIDAPVTARNGMTPEETAALDRRAGEIATRVGAVIGTDPARILLLGTEELMHLPVLVGEHLVAARPDLEVRCQSTTRSPVHAADDPGYAIRRSVTFTAPDDPTRLSRLHNVVDPAAEPAGGQAWSDLRHDHIVVVVDAPADACADLARALRPFAATVHVVPVGPESVAR